MTVRLEVPVECRSAVREELDKLPIAYREHMLKSAGWPAVFELISTAIQDVGALVATLGAIVQIVQSSRSHETNLTPQQSKWVTGMVSDENVQEAVVRLKDGRVLTVGSGTQQVAEEILRNTDKVNLNDAESAPTEGKPMEPSKYLHQAFATLCRHDPDMTKYFWLGVKVVSDNAPSSRLATRLNDYVFRNSISAFYRCIPVESDHDLFCLEEKAVTHLEQSLLHLTTTAFEKVHFCLFGAKMTTVPVSRLKTGLSAFNLLVELNPDGENVPAYVIADLTDQGILKSWIDDFLRRPGSLYSLIEEQ